MAFLGGGLLGSSGAAPGGEQPSGKGSLLLSRGSAFDSFDHCFSGEKAPLSKEGTPPGGRGACLEFFRFPGWPWGTPPVTRTQTLPFLRSPFVGSAFTLVRGLLVLTGCVFFCTRLRM